MERTMLKEKQIMDKLYGLSEKFKLHMREKDYARAKHCYDTARDVAVFIELDEKTRRELFGERGERGVIIRQGLFPEEQVQEAYYWECVKK